LSDGEAAWFSKGRGLYLFEHVFAGSAAAVEYTADAYASSAHPFQKPIAVMEWCLSFIDDAQVILDPFMGSGTTGVACAKLGRKFIGIEIEPKYFDIACRRIEQAYKQPDMFIERPPPPQARGHALMWIVIRTDYAKEFAVAKALTALGHDIWVPSYIVESRERVSVGPGVILRRSTAKERPLLPTLIFMCPPYAQCFVPSVRHLKDYLRGENEKAVLIPDAQVKTFRDRVEEINARERDRIANRGKDKRRKKSYRLSPEEIAALKAELFGVKMEEAA
jgi:16S rRNA G966 N2-methylase RsmD